MARVLGVKPRAGIGNDLLEARQALVRLVKAVLAQRLGLAAEVDDDLHQRRASLGEGRAHDRLQVGQVRLQVDQLAVAGDAPGIQPFEGLGLAHALHEAGSQVRLRSSSRRHVPDSQTTDCRIGSGRC